MSNQTKLRSTQTENNLKAGVKGFFESSIYQDASNIFGPLENVVYSHDIETITNPLQSTVFDIPAQQYRIIKNVFLVVKLNTGMKSNGSGGLTFKHATAGVYPDIRNPREGWLFGAVDSFQYTLPQSEQQTITGQAWEDSMISQVKGCQKIKEVYKLAGKAWTQYHGGDYLMAVLPFPWCSYNSGKKSRAKPFPLHLLTDRISARINWNSNIKVDATDTSIISGISIFFVYGDLANSDEYKVGLYKYLYSLPWSPSATGFPCAAPSTQIINGASLVGATNSFYHPKYNTGDTRIINLGSSFGTGDCQQAVIKYVPNGVAPDTVKLPVSGTPIKFYTRDAGYIQDTSVSQFYQYGSRLSDIELLLTGQSIYKSAFDNEKILQLFKSWKPVVIEEINGNFFDVAVTKGYNSSNLAAPSAVDVYFTTPLIQLGALGEFNAGDLIYQPFQGSASGNYTGHGSLAYSLMSFYGKTYRYGDQVKVVTNTGVITGEYVKPTPTLSTNNPQHVAQLGPVTGIDSKTLGAVTSEYGYWGAEMVTNNKTYVLKPHIKRSYSYTLDFAELTRELTTNGYSLGVDLQFAQLQLKFKVNSDDVDIMAAMAENATSGVLHVTQFLTAIYQFQGAGAVLIK